MATSPPTDPLGQKSLDFLLDQAEKSFGRQADLDGSIWNSLPFFAALLGAALTIVGHAASDVPRPQWSFYPLLANLLAVASTAMFFIAVGWFIALVWRRPYEIPADDSEIRLFAEQMSAFYAASDSAGDSAEASVEDSVDEAVSLELRSFMVDQYGNAARSNLNVNQRRLTARNQALLFSIAGFVLAFLCEVVIFVHGAAGAPAEVKTNGSAQNPITVSIGSWNQSAGATSDSAEGKARDRGCVVRQVDDRAHHSEEIEHGGREAARRRRAENGQAFAAGPAARDQDRAGRVSSDGISEQATTAEKMKQCPPGVVGIPHP
jgi:hypothetical protein